MTNNHIDLFIENLFMYVDKRITSTFVESTETKNKYIIYGVNIRDIYDFSFILYEIPTHNKNIIMHLCFQKFKTDFYYYREDNILTFRGSIVSNCDFIDDLDLCNENEFEILLSNIKNLINK